MAAGLARTQRLRADRRPRPHLSAQGHALPARDLSGAGVARVGGPGDQDLERLALENRGGCNFRPRRHICLMSCRQCPGFIGETLMDTASIAAAGVAMVQDKTQTSMQATLIKQQFQDDRAVVDLLAQSAAATPAPGTGKIVDKF